MKTIVVLGSARSDGHTRAAVEQLCPFAEYELIDLRTLNIHPYDYDHQTNRADDFLSVIAKLAEADHIVFATPVYWYAMSGLLKNFFDRFTDLLGTDLGRRLKGKSVYLIASGSDPELPPGFEVPFKMTADYLSMNYRQSFYQES